MSPPITMSASGLSVCWVVETTPDRLSENTINRPSVMLVSIAPQ